MSYAIAKFVVVDDDQVCVMAVQRTLKKLGLVNPVHIASNGEEALAILRGGDGRSALEPPYVVIIDLNMPRMGGLEFVDAVRSDDRLKRTVIFVMTTSNSPNDIDKAYARNIAGYILKDGFHESFERALGMIDSFARAVVLPT